MMQAIGSTPSPTISLTRSFTRLKTVYVTFYKPAKVVDYRDGAMEGTWGTYTELDINATHLPLREFNFFYHPQYLYPGDNIYGNGNMPDIVEENGFWSYQHNTEPEIQMQIGTKNFPETPMRSSAEMYYQLRKALGSHQPGSSYAVNILDKDYRSTHFIVGFDCERQTNAGFSGYNTRAGDLITMKILGLQHRSNSGEVIASSVPDFMHTTLEYDAIMTISDAGVTVLE